MTIPENKKTFGSFYVKAVLTIMAAWICVCCQPEKNERTLLELRSLSNLAFREHNITQIATYLTEDIAITTGNGTVIHGKDSLKSYLESVFTKNTDLYFVRETSNVKLNKVEDRAWETGTWKGLRLETPDWKTIRGMYAAMWVKTAGGWKIRAELFVQLY